jgi:tRNA pseudouridine55 synthase
MMPPNKPHPAGKKRVTGQPPRSLDPFDGILLVDKPAGPTSHDIVDRIRKHFGFRKVGHAGTLDPLATGLLVILIGKGTRLSQQLMGSDKIYEGIMHLGVTTDSQDADGEITAEHDASHVTEHMLQAEMNSWIGDRMQTPPMVSAIKKNGVPLYKLARKGKTVERKPRLIHIYEFTLQEFMPPKAAFRLACTKGTYVRTICADVGTALKCGAYLEQLRRTQSGKLSVSNALPLHDYLALDRRQLEDHIISINTIHIKELV